MWQSEIVLGQGRWEIHIRLKAHELRQEAEHFAQYGVEDPTLVIHENEYAISVCCNDAFMHFKAQDLAIYEAGPEKDAALRQSCSDLVSAERDKILELLNAAGSPTLDPSERVPSRYTLEDFFVAYGIGASLSIIDWSVCEV